MQTPPPPTRFALARGDSRRVHVPRGMQLVSLGGPVLLEQTSRALGGGFDTPALRLADGEAVVIEQRGWVTLTAGAPAELVCLAPPPPAWRRVLAAFHLFPATPNQLAAHDH
jgi:hypothetical protein